MNQYPLWRYILIAVVIGSGVLYALPNIYGSDPALQVSARRAEAVDQALLERVSAALTSANITAKRIELEEKRLLLRFDTTEVRERARDVVLEAVGDQRYIVALNLAPSTPDWLRAIGGKPMYMGLDLRGGVHFLMQVDMDAVRVQTEERFASELRTAFRIAKIRYRPIARDSEGGLRVSFLNEAMKARGVALLSADFADLSGVDVDVSTDIRVTISDTLMEETRRTALKQNLTTLRNRVNEFGVAEPVIQQQGDARIVVQLPWN